MKRFSTYISLFIIIVTIFYSYYSLMPRSISDTSTPLTEFSTERALIHLKQISKKAHYVGTKEHKNVREYIVSELQKLGLTVEIQEQEVFRKYRNVGTKAHNIIAKIAGSNSAKAVLLSSHYDSGVRGAVGASDAGSGVVTIMEALRAYRVSGKQPKNDIIILITDAEELGLLGAAAFVEKHPLVKEIGIILNFEARGSGGPSYMLMETNGGNKNLVKHFKKANASHPLSTSLMYSIYKMLSNDTDLTVFRENADIEGYNFAFIDDHFDYHTPQDNFERIDKASLEHQGTYIMPLLNYFADADLTNLKSEVDYVFFNFPIIGMVYYPFSWIIPMVLFTVLMFIGLVVYGVSKKRIDTKEALKGFLPFLATVLVSIILGKYGWELVQIIYPQYNDIRQGFTYNGHTYIIAFAALTIAVCFFIYNNFFSKLKTVNLLIAPVFIWIVINIVITIYLKGAAFFIISVIFGLISLAILLFLKSVEENKTLLITIASLPILLVFSPNIQAFPVGLGLSSLVISTTLITLLFGLLIPIFSKYKKIKLDWVFLVIAIVAFISASFQSSYTKDRKKPNGVNYTLNTDTNEAFWSSSDNSLDEFTAQFFGNDIQINDKSYYKFYKKADVKPIKAPTIVINKDTITNNLRLIEFSIITNRKANKIALSAKNNFTIKNLNINGFNFEKGDKDYIQNTENRKWIKNYNFSYQDSVLNVSFSVLPNEKPKLIISEISYDLLKNPNFSIKPRKDYMMLNSYPNDVVDAIVLEKEVSFDNN